MVEMKAHYRTYLADASGAVLSVGAESGAKKKTFRPAALTRVAVCSQEKKSCPVGKKKISEKTNFCLFHLWKAFKSRHPKNEAFRDGQSMVKF